MKGSVTLLQPTAARLDWETPEFIFGPLNAEFGFTLDVCATHENRKCECYFSPSDNGLTRDWGRNACWMNPPYGPEIRDWLRKAYEASLRGAVVVCLVPARTDTRWWHDYAEKASERRFVPGRVPYLRRDGQRSRAPFPSVIVVFRPGSA